MDPIAPSHYNTELGPDSLMTGGPVELPVDQHKRVTRRKRSRSPSGDAGLARTKRTRRTRKDNTGAAFQTPQLVGSPPVDGTDLNPPVSQPEVSGPPPQKYARRPKQNDSAPFSRFSPQVQDMMNTLGGLGPDHVATKSLPPLLRAHGPLPLRRCARDRMVIALQTFTAPERR